MLEVIWVRENKEVPQKTQGSFVGMLYKLQLKKKLFSLIHLYTEQQNHYRFLKRKITCQNLCFRKVMPEGVGCMFWVEETPEAQVGS